MNELIQFPEMDEETLNRTILLVYKYTGIRMNASKKTLLQSRLRQRMNFLNLNEYKDYLKLVEDERVEIQEFINVVTTNETYFFRTKRIWEYFSQDFLPKWHIENQNSVLRVWSAAASTGEEAHSMVIALEEFKLKNHQFQYEVFASDIDTQVLEKGRLGTYGSKSVDNFKKIFPELYKKYILEVENYFQLEDKYHKKIQFFNHDLFKPTKHQLYFDIVFLRNVLIYFDNNDQEKVLSQISKSIKSNGTLVIGESESLNNLKTSFLYQQPLIYTKTTGS